MATSKRPITKPGEDRPILFTVTVAQEVGVVRDDQYGEHPALKVAFMMLADYFAEQAQAEHNQYTFTITPEGGNPRGPITVTAED
jgi:hypothetical protein